MTEYVDGKKYKLTVTGTFHKPKPYEFGIERFHIDGTVDDALYPGPHLAVELIPDPLPTTPGSVVKALNGRHMMRVEGGFLFDSPLGAPAVLKDDQVLYGWTLIYDAGAK